jgi:hypothetical protein
MQGIKNHLRYHHILPQYQATIDKAWGKPWVVFCEPSFGSPRHIVGYLGQYTHRVAISNQRILDVDDAGVTFLHKDYRDKARQKPIKLPGVEFLRRFCMHFLPLRFVKIRYYGIYGSRFKAMVRHENKKLVIIPKETTQERVLRLTGVDVFLCPFCKKGRLVAVRELPRVRSPSRVFFHTMNTVTV